GPAHGHRTVWTFRSFAPRSDEGYRPPGRGGRGAVRGSVMPSVEAKTTGTPAVTEAPAVAVRLDGVRKRFGDVMAVDGVHLDVLEGEFFSLLGPSGSGKTTCLR